MRKFRAVGYVEWAEEQTTEEWELFIEAVDEHEAYVEADAEINSQLDELNNFGELVQIEVFEL